MRYQVIFTPRAERLFRKLPQEVLPALGRAIDNLASTPRPPTMGKGPDGTHKLRAGDYWILYDIQDDRLIVLAVKVGHRRDVYRGMIR
jgi:mRNA interferase RelE/StbE